MTPKSVLLALTKEPRGPTLEELRVLATGNYEELIDACILTGHPQLIDRCRQVEAETKKRN